MKLVGTIGLRHMFIFAICAAGLMFAGGCGPDISTPKKSAQAFAKALQSGDISTARKCAKGTDAQLDSLKDLGEMMKASKDFQDAMKSKFPDQGDLLKGTGGDPFSDIDNAEEKINGDKATLVPKNGFGGLEMKKDSDGWKVDLGDMPVGGGAGPNIKPMIDAMNATTKEINDGKFKTAKDALNAMGQRMLK